MTDTDKLKRLEMVRRVARVSDRTGRPVMIEADDCRAILALIAENEKIEAERAEFKAWFRRASDEINAITDQRDEAVALLNVELSRLKALG